MCFLSINLLQSGHWSWGSFTPKCKTLMCFLQFDLSEKAFPHRMHLNFSTGGCVVLSRTTSSSWLGSIKNIHWCFLTLQVWLIKSKNAHLLIIAFKLVNTENTKLSFSFIKIPFNLSVNLLYYSIHGFVSCETLLFVGSWMFFHKQNTQHAVECHYA